MAQNKVMIIPARRQVGNTVKAADKPKLRVAAYCRVSTDSDEQATSYETQIEHYTEYISKNPDWQLAGIFADDGISGTNTKKREEFNRMISECNAGNIDMIITKSISRFARNTLDCLKYIRELKEKNIPVYFEKESINTMDAKGEVLITIMASLAQQESQSLSQNVKLGLQYRYQQGKVIVNYNHFLGYTKGEDGKLVIEPKEAEIVKRIFREYLEGYSINTIASNLERDKILTGAGKRKWWTSSINKMLRNEKYIGDALLQKTYTTDFLTKTRVKNHGLMPQYYVEANHPAIIPKETFMRVQEELVRRRIVNVSVNGRKQLFCSKHCFTQVTFCGNCGERFRRIHWNNNGCKSIVWRCVSRLENTGVACRARTVKEELLEKVVIKAINEMILSKSNYLEMLQNNITTVIQKNAVASTSEIDEKLMTLQNELLKKAHNRDAYDDVAEEIFQLRELKSKSESGKIQRNEKLSRITDLCDFIKSQPAGITEFDDSLIRRLIKKITVFDDHFTVEFKSGVSMKIKE